MTDLDIDDAERKNEEAQKRAKRKRERELEDFRSVLASAQGRRFVQRILAEVGIYRPSFDNNALQMAFKEGKRDVGLFLMIDLNAHFLDRYNQMQREAASDQKIEKQNQEKKEEN